MQDSLNEGYTCDNLKLLEVVMEHLLFHWEDITDLLIDELIEEEVIERNRLEIRGDGCFDTSAFEDSINDLRGGYDPIQTHQELVEAKREATQTKL